MLRLRLWPVLASALLTGTIAAAATTPPDTMARPLLLEVRLNGIEQPQGVEALPIAGGLALPVEAWQALQLRPPQTAPVRQGGRSYHVLDASGVRWRLDTPTQTLWIDAPASAFAGGPVITAAAPAALRPQVGLGAYGNYDLLWQRATRGGPTSASALTEVGVFGGIAYFRMTNLIRLGGTGRASKRLDTTWVMDDPARMASLRVGDTIGVPGTWGRATRFGGIQWTTDFSLQPGFQAFPLPSLRGETSLPSTVDLYVDNNRRLQGSVQPGAFDLHELPVVTGQGEIRMVVRDLLGREQVIVAPYYASTALLRPGLHATSFELGAIREGYGVASQRYGALFAGATDRLGIDDRYTREWRAEASSRQLSLGYGGTWLFPSLGTLQLSGVGSHRSQGSGGMVIAAVERQAPDWSGSLQLKAASRDFAQIGTAPREPMRTTVALAVGRAWHGVGIGASFLQQTTWDGPRRQIVGMNLSRSVGGVGTLALFALRDAVSGQVSLSLSFSCSLDGRSSASTVVNRQQGEGRSRQSETLLWQRPMQDSDGVGIQLAAERGEFSRNTAQAQWQTNTVLLSAGVAQSREGSEVRAGASGGFAWLGDSVFASRRIEGSFAVVEVGDYPDVTVLHDHHPVAATDHRGRALVSSLRGNEVNRIDIDPSGLPFDAEVESFETLVIPPARSGVAVAIPLKRVSAASFRVVGADGTAIPVGSELQLVGQERRFPIGFDGRAYASGLSGHDRAVVRWMAHQCAVQLTLPPTDDDAPDLGTLRCL
jgi:outer membrane usher protein